MDDFYKQAVDIVKAQAAVRPMTTEEVVSMVQTLTASLASLGSEPVAVAQVAPPVNAKKSIKEKSVTCLECGKVFKLITAKHLALHGLDKAEYLLKHGLKKGTSLTSRALVRSRKKKMQEMRLWERKGKKKDVAKPTKAAAKAAAPPAPPRQRVIAHKVDE